MLCPFTRKKCLKDECPLYRKGMKHFANGQPPVPFEGCGLEIIVDCLEGLLLRSLGQQKAAEQTRNEVNKLRNFFVDLVEHRKVLTG